MTLSRLREHFGSAGLVVAIIALVAALAGGAVAATGGPGNSKASASAKGKQGPRGKTGKAGPQGPAGPIGPQGPKGETGAIGTQGERGPIGPAGERGKAGKAGKAGEDGEEGEAGEPWTAGGTLPPGETETGSFSYYDPAAERELNEADYPGLVLPRLETVLPVSFPIPLAAALPEANVHVAPNENCPGSAADPQAAPGHFCAYAGASEGGTSIAGVYPPDVPFNLQGAATAGAMLYVVAGQGIWGTWAVTAPTVTGP